MIKHSKYKNSGILYELLVKKITSDIFAGNNSPAAGIIKKYYKNTELSKEHKLYTTLINARSLSESKAETIINSVLEASKKLNKSSLKREKYNLIKEIKKYYDVNLFFREKVNNYTELAAISNLLEANQSLEFVDPTSLIENKMTILEHISKSDVDQDNTADKLLEEYSKMPKGTRILTYKILLEKFNEKYSVLCEDQKQVLKSYLNNMDNAVVMNEFLNEKLVEVKAELTSLIERIDDDTIKIKARTIVEYINPIAKNSSVKDDDVVELLQYYQLVKELKDANE